MLRREPHKQITHKTIKSTAGWTAVAAAVCRPVVAAEGQVDKGPKPIFWLLRSNTTCWSCIRTSPKTVISCVAKIVSIQIFDICTVRDA
jgi:hypothetical protein